MTKLDRAIKNEKDLEELSHFYKSENLTATDLFELLKKVIDKFLEFYKITVLLCNTKTKNQGIIIVMLQIHPRGTQDNNIPSYVYFSLDYSTLSRFSD